MKKIPLVFILLLCLFSSSEISAQEHSYTRKEYFVIRVNFALRKTGIVAQFHPDLVTDKAHSLFGKITVENEVAMHFTMTDGKVEIAASETDMLNIMSKLGWNLLKVFEFKLMSDTYQEYIFEKS